MTGWTIRSASRLDAAAIAEVHVSAWQKAYRGQVPQSALDALSIQQHTKEWSDHLAAPLKRGERVWVSCAGGIVVGFAWVERSRDHDLDPDFDNGLHKGRVAELVAVYVHPNAWGQGIGRALIERSVEGATADGFNALALWVLEANRRARKLYHRLGFKPDGVHELRPIGGVRLPMLRYRANLGAPPNDRGQHG